MRGLCWVACLLLAVSSVCAEDLAIVRVNTRPEPGQGASLFTATHLGNGVLLTCGHCCRAAGGPGAKVDIQILSAADWKPYRSAPATVSCQNDAADVGVMLFDHRDAMRAACTLAPRDYDVEVGTPVVVYTWSPTGKQLRSIPTAITNVNLFRGAPNLETKQAPVPGDSGAPLILRGDRLVIGVTTGADYWSRFGVHAGLNAVHDVLQRCPVQPPIAAIRTASSHLFEEDLPPTSLPTIKKLPADQPQ